MTFWRWLAPALLLVLASCARRDEPAASTDAEVEARAIPVTVAPVTVRPSERAVRFVGTLFGHEEVILSSQVEGQIESIEGDLGDAVQAGQVLAKIEDDQLRARLREVEAMLDRVRADESRGRQLMTQRVISPQEYESMKTQASVVEAQRDTMTVLLRYTEVRTPLTGSVAKRMVSVGEYVRPGTPMFALVADDRLILRGDVPERFSAELQVDQVVRVQVDAFPHVEFGGHLTRISPASNRENRSITVEALVDNSERELKPGFFANASIVTRADQEAMMVPQEALITFAGVTKVFVVAGDIAHERQVRTGSRTPEGLVEVIEGLRPDEAVATSGLTRLENGRAVMIKRPGDVRESG
jgi:RND family efflux transporter MFP subunit